MAFNLDDYLPGGSSGGDAPAPSNVVDIITAAANKYGVDPKVALALADTESSMNPNAVGPDTKYGNGRGLFQIMDAFHKDYGITDATDPVQNADGAMRMFKANLDARDGNYPEAIAAHQAGLGAVQRANGIPNATDGLSTTPQYVAKVLAKAGGVPTDAGASTPASTVVPTGRFNLDDYLNAPQPAAPDDSSALGRGLKSGVQQLKQTAAGLVGLAGEAVGSTPLRDWGMDKYIAIGQSLAAQHRDSDDFSNVLSNGGTGIGSYVAFTLGDAFVNLLPAVLGGGFGGIIGKKVVAGAAREAVEAAMTNAITNTIGEKIAAGATVDAALTKTAQQAGVDAAQAVLEQGASRGAMAGNVGYGVGQEAGTVYPEAEAESEKTGQPVDMGKVWLASLGGGALMGIGRQQVFGSLLHGVESEGGIAVRMATGAGADAAILGGQGVATTAINRLGEGKDLTSNPEDYLNAGVGGAITGGLIGAVSGVRRARTASDAATPAEAADLPITPVISPDEIDAKRAAAQPLLLPNPDTPVPGAGFIGDEAGNVRPATSRDLSDRAAAERAQQAQAAADLSTGNTPDVRAALDKMLASANDDIAALKAAPADQSVESALAKVAPAPTGPTIDEAAHQAATSPKNDLQQPTPAMQSAGNFQLGHTDIGGLDVSITHPDGSVRAGIGSDGQKYARTMSASYGYIKGTIGADGDHVDVYVKPGTPTDYQGPVYVIDQRGADGKFDEHKTVLGASSPEEAKALYDAHYPQGFDRAGAVTTLSMPDFKQWLATGDKSKPISDTFEASRGNTQQGADRTVTGGRADAGPSVDAATLHGQPEAAATAAPAEDRGVAGSGRPVSLQAGEVGARAAELTPDQWGAKLTGSPVKMRVQRDAQRADYFTPGNIVEGYGAPDRVISYTPPSDGKPWSVKVEHVVKADDGTWQKNPMDMRVRTHATEPSRARDKIIERAAQAGDAGARPESSAAVLESRGTPGDELEAYRKLGFEPHNQRQMFDDAARVTGLSGRELGVKVGTGQRDMDARTPMHFDADTRTIEVNPALRATRAMAAQHAVEEMLHAVDVLDNGNSLSASSKRLAIDGDIRKEVEAHVDAGDTYAQFLSYPLRYDPPLPDGRIRAELFARLGTLYHGEPEEMRAALPTTYEAIHEIFQRGEQPDSDRVRGSVREGGAVTSEARSGLRSVGRDAGDDARGAEDGQETRLGRLRERIVQTLVSDRGGRRVLNPLRGTDDPTAFRATDADVEVAPTQPTTPRALDRRDMVQAGRGHDADRVTTSEAAQAVVDRVTSTWKNVPDTKVVASFDDLPAAVRADAADQELSGVRGVLHGDKLYVVADAHASPEDIERTVFHEAWGHYGLRSLFGSNATKELSSIFDRAGGLEGLRDLARKNGISIDDDVEAIGKSSMSDAEKSRVLVEELVAKAQEGGSPSFIQKVKEIIGSIRQWLRDKGFATLAKFSDSDLAKLIGDARDAVVGDFAADREPDDILKTAITGDQPSYFRKGETPPGGDQTKNMPEWVQKLGKDQQDTLKKAGIWIEKKPLSQRWQEMRQEAGLKIVQKAVDQYRPILSKIGDYPYKLLRMAGSSGGALESSMRNGHIELNDAGALRIKADTKGLLETLKPLNGETDRFLAWVAGNRAERLMAEGREHNFSPEGIEFLKSLNGSVGDDAWKGEGSRGQAYAEVLKGWNAYGKSILDIAEKAGVINSESRATWEHEFYVPFFREREDAPAIPGNISGMVNQKGPKRLKGGAEDLHDLLANSLGNWASLLDSSLRNNAARETLAGAEKLGIADRLSSAEKGSVYYLDNGKPVHYEVHDPLVLDAIGSLAASPFKGPVMKALGAFKHALTVGTTMSPVFRIRHTIREQITAMAANPTTYNFVKNLVDGFKYSDKHNPLYGQMEAGGAFMRMGQSLDGDRAEYVKRMIQNNVDQATILDTPSKVKGALKGYYDWWKETGERSDAITRANLYRQEYQRRIDAGETEDRAHFEAAYVARDVMDFGLHGTNAAVRMLTQVVPFMNARMQGIYKLGRGAVEDPRRFAAVIGGVSMATIALSLASRNDDEIQALPDVDHDNNWIFRIPGTNSIFRIPKPFEVGALATVIDRGLQVALDGFQPADREKFVSRLLPIVGSQLAMNPVPQAVWPLVQLWANKDVFRGAQIESEHDQSLTSDQRIGPNTSAAAQLLGKVTGKVGLSPEQIDFLVNSYLGWVGSHAVATADLAIRPTLGLPSKPADRINDYFLVGDFVHELPSAQSKFVNDFYAHMAQVQQTMADVRQFKQLGNPGAAAEMTAANPNASALADDYRKASEAISKLNLRARLVDASPTIDPDQKRVTLDNIAQQKNALAKQAETFRAALLNR